MTRGGLPDRHLTSARAGGAQRDAGRTAGWTTARYGERFRGTIRVNPDDIEGALKEIERWREHPRVVQIGVPLQSHALYGKPQFWPLWDAAADAGLPVAVHIETGTGIDFAPTPSGPPRTYPQYVGFMGAELHLPPDEHDRGGRVRAAAAPEGGVRRRWRRPADPVHLADGHLRPPAPRTDPVGAARCPATTCPGTCTSSRAPWTAPATRTWPPSGSRMTGKEDMVMFGSSYPHWQHQRPVRVAGRLDRRAARQGALAQRGPAVRHGDWPSSGTRSREKGGRSHDDDRDARARRQHRAGRRPGRRLRRPPGAPRRGARPVHPGAVPQQVLPQPQGRRHDQLRRARLRVRQGDAGGHVPGRRRLPRQRPGPGVPAADPGRRFGHRHPRTGRARPLHPRGHPGAEDRHQPLAGQPLAGQQEQLAPALARLDLRRRSRTPQGAAREIEYWAGHPYMSQVLINAEPRPAWGDPKYDPIWAAAVRHDIPVSCHLGRG